MTDEQRSFYLLLCMTGRTQEATEYSHFTIKMSDREDECGTDTDFMVARNEHDEYMTGRIVGVDECWQDGDLNTCVAGLLRGIATIAHSRY